MKTPRERKELNTAAIKRKGIACLDTLPETDDVKRENMRTLDEICERAIASLLSTQVACDIQDGDYEESVSFFLRMLDQFGVSFRLNSLEKKLFEGNYEDQDVINVSWEYETYWALCWALGLVDDISDGTSRCDVFRAVSLVGDCETYEQFRDRCKLRDAEEILDMLDLYYRYHWATVENRINPESPVGDLSEDIVMERRRGLEWLFSAESDWFDISLDT